MGRIGSIETTEWITGHQEGERKLVDEGAGGKERGREEGEGRGARENTHDRDLGKGSTVLGDHSKAGRGRQGWHWLS